MIETIISIIANILSIFGITIDIQKAKKIFNIWKNRNKLNRTISFLLFLCICCILIICIYIYKQKSIIVTKVTLSEESLTMSVNETHILTAKVLYSNNTINDDVIWSSSNNSIASVDQNGLVTALSNGSATIIVQASKNNSTEIAECTITIKSPPSGYSISARQLSDDSFAYIYVEPYDDNITNVQIYGKSPSGEIFILNKASDDLYHFYSESGIWTIYASVQNDMGKYEAHKPEDFITIKVTNATDIVGESIEIFNKVFKEFTP